MSSLSIEEINKIRVANKIVAKVNREIASIAKPGVSLIELDDVARKLIRKEGGEPIFLGYQGFPKSICTSVNEALIHGIPNGYKLKDGDLLSVDTGVNYQGYAGDSAISIHIGKPNKNAVKIVDAANEALEEALKILKPGIYTGDIGNVIESVAQKNGYKVTHDFVGHGLGKTLHESPQVPCYGKKKSGTMLEEGMVICIEPMLLTGTKEITIDKLDRWTVRSKNSKLTAHVEHAVLITKDGYEILDV
ncbi:MAG: type I methionyl aminopeptidase [Mycoplasmataceae bacterium]|nr:type I methionyl aminopeptidase [Mycoplasmataceae bacterium]